MKRHARGINTRARWINVYNGQICVLDAENELGMLKADLCQLIVNE